MGQVYLYSQVLRPWAAQKVSIVATVSCQTSLLLGLPYRKNHLTICVWKVSYAAPPASAHVFPTEAGGIGGGGVGGGLGATPGGKGGE
jgi:hypothetical protein